MKQLVQELAKQAEYDSLLEKYYLQEVHKTKITPTEYQNIYNNKFAELIVQQCADVCSNVLDYHAILEKFGVEE